MRLCCTSGSVKLAGQGAGTRKAGCIARSSRFGPGRSGGVLAAVQRAAFGGAHHSKFEISFLPDTPAMASRLTREHKDGASQALRRAREHQTPPSKLRRGESGRANV